jgi:hypothetical protein
MDANHKAPNGKSTDDSNTDDRNADDRGADRKPTTRAIRQSSCNRSFNGSLQSHVKSGAHANGIPHAAVRYRPTDNADIPGRAIVPSAFNAVFQQWVRRTIQSGTVARIIDLERTHPWRRG